MKTLKKSLCILLSVMMIMGSCLVFSSAAEESTYVADYDTETPVILVHGMSQNNTYVLDENGERIKGDDGKLATGWPLQIDIMALLKTALPSLLKAIITRQDAGLADALYQAAFDALPNIHKDNQGNYLKNIEVPCYEMPMSQLPADVKEEYYKFLPVQELGEIIGEDNLYYFGYDSIGDVHKETEKLHHYIHDVVLPQTKATQVKLCHISLGGTIAINYLENYPEDYSLIKKVVFVEPALDGSDIIGDILIGNISVFYDNEDLYENLMVTLLGETPVAYLVNMVLRILPETVLKGALQSLVKGVAEVAIRPTTILWALCPTDYYEQARKIWLEDESFAKIAAEVDQFMEARADFEENLFALRDSGAQLYDVVCYDVPLFPLCKDYKKTNADRVIHAASTSIGATFADLGTTLGEGYTAAGTYCDDPSHNHLSPDGVVDPTTGLLPCTTWYFKGQAHELLPFNDVALKLSIRLMTDNNMVDVYSNPEAYPQFNSYRLNREINTYRAAWAEADKKLIPQSKVDAIEAALDKVEALENETVIDNAAWTAAEAELANALYAAGVIENPNPTCIEKVLTEILKAANKTINKGFEFIK